MRFELRLPRARFAANEEISLEVALTNDGPSPVECPDPFHALNWQPRYTLTGPQYPQGHSFSFRSAVKKDPRPNPPGVVPELIQVPPGATHASDIPLSQWVPLREPGHYTLEARLEWGELVVEAPPIGFELQELVLSSLSLGIDVGAASATEAWVGWLREGEQGRVLGDALFREGYADPVGMKRLHMSSVATVSPAASEVLAPHTNYDRKAQLTFWRAWREDSRLLALAAGASAPQALELGPATLLLTPALMTAAGELEVFVLSPDTGALGLARFAPGKPPRLVGGPALPGRLLSARAALGPPEAGSPRHLVAVSLDEEDKPRLHHIAAGDGSQLAPPRTIPLPVSSWTLQSTPAVRVHPSGGLDVALLTFMDEAEQGHVPAADTPPVLTLVEASFAPGGGRVEPRITSQGRLPRFPRSACASYVVAPGGPERIDWVVLLEEGGLINSFSPQEVRRPKGRPVEPPELLSLNRAGYLLVSLPSGGPGFELLF